MQRGGTSGGGTDRGAATTMQAQLDSGGRRRRVDAAFVGVLCGIYGLWFLAASPRAEIPLNDDWAYAQTVRTLLETGRLRVSDWTAASIVFQTVWGAVFAWAGGGFSFTVLRASTLTASFLGALGCYALLCELGLPRRNVWLAVLALVVNPLFVYLSYTFMSDIFYFSLMAWSLWAYARGLRRGSVSALWAGAACAGAAYLSRQVALVLPAAAALAWVVRERRRAWGGVLAIVAVPLAVCAVHEWWLRAVHGVPWGFQINVVQNNLRASLTSQLPLWVFWKILLSCLYLGVFALPLSVAHAGRPWWAVPRGARRRVVILSLVWFVVLAAICGVTLGESGRVMPYLGSVINRSGLGPRNLHGDKLPFAPPWIFGPVTVLAVLGGAAQGALWTEAVWRLRRVRGGPWLLLPVSGLLMLAPTVLMATLWDRYFLVLLPAAFAFAVGRVPVRWSGWAAGVVTCAVFLVYSLTGMNDCLHWNLARWTAGRRAVARGVAPGEVDGGFEWLGWYEFESALPRAIAAGQGRDLWAWTRVTPKRYRLSFTPLPESRVVDRVPYRIPWQGERGNIYVLEPAVPDASAAESR